MLLPRYVKGLKCDQKDGSNLEEGIPYELICTFQAVLLILSKLFYCYCCLL